jgi:hypothetical protein
MGMGGYDRSVKFAPKLLLVSALMVSIGAQWALLQGVAWVGMVLTYSMEEGSVAQGLSKTFDGKHPCPLCQVVKKGTQDKQAPVGPSPTDGSKFKAEMCLFQRAGLALPTADRLPITGLESERAMVRRDAPTGPPPEWPA